MTPLSTAAAAAALGVSASHLRGLARAASIQPDRAPTGCLGRGDRLAWTARHLLALALVAPLRRSGIPAPDAAAFARGIAELPSDAELEAAIRERPFALVAAPYLCPDLLDAGTLGAVGEPGGMAPTALTRPHTTIHVRDLYHELLDRSRAAAGVSHAAP